MTITKFTTVGGNIKTRVITSFNLFQNYDFEENEVSECLISQKLIEALEKKEINNYLIFYKEYQIIINLAETLSLQDSPFDEGRPNFIVTSEGKVYIGKGSSMHDIAKRIKDYKDYLRSIDLNGYCKKIIIQL